MAVVVQRVLWVPFLVLAALGASIARSGAVAPVKAGDTPGHPGGQPLQSVGVLPACTTCSDFCEGRCSFEGPPGVALGVVQNLTVVRYTPSDVPGLTNKNSGDAAGDLYFGLEELVTPMHCRHDPTYFKCQNGTPGALRAARIRSLCVHAGRAPASSRTARFGLLFLCVGMDS